jgi:hypothetical protein
MNVNTAANVLLIAAAVVWILAKQIRPAPVKTRMMVAAPLVMAYFGIKETPVSTLKSTADLGFIAVGALFSIGLGLWRGTTIRVWRGEDGRWWRAGSKYTLLLWGALLVVRALLAGAADATGHKAADGLGPILFSLALSFAAQSVVTAMRISGAPAAEGYPQAVPLHVNGSTPVDAAPWTRPASQSWPSRHERIAQRRDARRARRGRR